MSYINETVICDRVFVQDFKGLQIYPDSSKTRSNCDSTADRKVVYLESSFLHGFSGTQLPTGTSQA